MEISHLTSFGIPEIIVDSWRSRMGETLLPLQEKAVRDFHVLDGCSLLVSAPTSSGKTFCGEMAAAATIFRRKKAVLLVPLKSIAEEKYRDFSAKYSPLGIRVVIATRDHREFEGCIEKGEFDLAVIVYEKFNILITKNIDLLGAVDLILIDEIQMLGDPSRGADLELALLKVLASGHSPQIVAFSAVLPDAEHLADWLGCKVLLDRYRPVELKQGVLFNGRYRYRSFNTGEYGNEAFTDCVGDDPAGILCSLVRQMVEAGEQILIFLKARRNCEQMACALAQSNTWKAAESVRADLMRIQRTRLSEGLLSTLQAGVAFHHAGLSHRQRQILESGFRDGEIRVLLSTTTLALGVNLPAQSVIIDCYKYARGTHSRKLLPVSLGWSEYENMSGRAGRLGQTESGRAILIAGSEIEEESLWKSYIEGVAQPLESQLTRAKPLAETILSLVSARCVASVQKLEKILAQRLDEENERSSEKMAAALGDLCRSKLLFKYEWGYEASPLGKVITLKGISVSSGILLRDALAGCSTADALSWFYNVLLLTEAEESRLPSYILRDVADPRERVYEYRRGGNEISPQLERLLDDGYLLTEDERDSLRTAWLLQDWISSMPTAALEQHYQTSLGSIMQIAEQASWLLEAAAGIAEVLNLKCNLAERLRRLGAATARGYDLPDTVLPTFGLSCEQRDLAWLLFNRGISEPDDVSESNRPLLAQVLGAQRAEQLIEKFIKKREKSESNAKEERRMPRLRLPTVDRGNRVVISFADTDIDVTPKSFNYLFKLAAGRLLSDEGWLDKEEIEPGFNQAKNIYRVKQELKRYGTGLERFIENNKSGRYRLNLSPTQIQVDYGSMESCSDLELAELSRRLRSKHGVAVAS